MKIKLRFILLLFFVSLIVLNQSAGAHGLGPHGGQTAEMTPFHLEYIIASGMGHFYVLDEKGKSIATSEITGKLIAQSKDGSKKEVALSVMGDALMASGLDDKSAFVAIVTLQVQGKSYTARINYDPNLKSEGPAASSSVQKVLKGRIVDISCYLTHNSQGESHKQCARECALKGLPMGILAEDGFIYQIIPIGHLEPKSVNQTILDYLEEKVVVDGVVSENNGMRVVMINKIEKLS